MPASIPVVTEACCVNDIDVLSPTVTPQVTRYLREAKHILSVPYNKNTRFSTGHGIYITYVLTPLQFETSSFHLYSIGASEKEVGDAVGVPLS